MSFMHNSLGVVHRDLKPKSLLLDTEGKKGAQIKIVYFGFACLKPELDSADPVLPALVRSSRDPKGGGQD